MSWKAQVQTSSCRPNEWTANTLCFETEAEAMNYAADLMDRWTSMTNYKAEKSDDPVNAQFVGYKLIWLCEAWPSHNV